MLQARYRLATGLAPAGAGRGQSAAAAAPAAAAVVRGHSSLAKSSRSLALTIRC
jgi:hypothetical protein